jgi:hypothetical protein
MTACLWCDQSFESRETGGKPQRFCCPAHRREFDTAARRYVRCLLDAGFVSVADLRNTRQGNARVAPKRVEAETPPVQPPAGLSLPVPPRHEAVKSRLQ